ncbi:disabled [Anopheles darlingi]|uniref:Disabled n=1 Tax=Anopheles darlingi TaxID=43151 RepID=W5JB81_ANODA|nr:disabled [Anopheles darlingi]
MQTIRKKTSPLKYRNEPGRFFGDGVSFKAKLIGILEVGEARGDRMCQEALQDLKMAIRAAGEHKQRITIHVTIDGLRLRDEKTGDSLYHHPVHKISFIAQDMTDSRAFGYIFGSPDSGHRFFGIKTDKAASQVVLAMRDLFQVVFELKKKEIELARQHIQSKITAHEHQAATSATLMSAKSSGAMDGGGSYGKNHSSDPLGVLAATSGSGGASSSSRDAGASSSKGSSGMGTLGKSEKSPESVADLVDLEQELSCIQRGITQMERITPSEGPGKSVIDDDPFGDSFANIPPAYNLLPPPESSKRHQKQANNRSTENLPKASETSPVVVSSSPPPVAAPPVPSSAASYESAASTTPGGVSSSAQAAAAAAAATTVPNANNNNSNSQPASRHTPLLSTSQSSAQNDDWLNSPPNTSRFDPDPVRYSDEPKLAEESPKVQPTGSAAQPSSYTDVFTDLDPLGTGKIKPYIDKKYFFQELKNPPKKVLKDLSGKDTATFNANFASDDHPLGGSGGGSMLNASNISTLASGSGELFKANFEEAQAKMHAEPPPMVASDDGGGLSSSKQQQQSTTLETSLGASGPASATKNVDLFQEDEDFSKLQLDPFEVHFSRNASPRPPGPSQRGAEHRSSDGGEEGVGEGGLVGGNRGEEEPSETTGGKAGVYNGPLQVNLPPESWASYISQKRLERQTSEANAQQLSGIGGSSAGVSSMARNRPAASSVFKQNTVDVISSLSSSSKKMKPNLFGQKFSKRDSNSINMRRLQESDSLSETETAPEPPPRPDSASHIEPPPLPPKKQFADIVIRPSPRSSASHNAGVGGNSSNSFGDRGSAGGGGQRYDYVGSKYDSSTNRSSPQATGGGSGPASDAPPLPLPSRKVGRTSAAAGDTIGPGRPPHRKSNEEEDYLTPIAGKPDIPTLLPPPQRKDGSKTTRSNTRKQSETDPRNLDEPTPPPTSKSPLSSVFSKEPALHSHSKQHQSLGGIGSGAGSSSFLPDITLSQLLTLGIDELAAKLGVPVSKLSTMTLVELTSYLSEFIENSKQPTTGSIDGGYPDAVAGGRDGSVSESPVFKVNFDDSNEFVAKFDDNFGEDDHQQQQQHRGAGQRSIGSSFVANFDELNMQSTTASRSGFGASSQTQPSAPSVSSTSVIDKYAVFREIMDQDTGGEPGAGSTGGDSDREQEHTGASGGHGRLDLQAEVTTEMNRLSPAFAGESLSPSATGSGGTAFGLLAGTGNTAPLSQLPMTKIDTKITEVISQAKDRYAALRDIILVEDLFEKPAPMARGESSSFEERDAELDDAKFEANFDDMIAVVGTGTGDSPGINISDVSEPSNVELDDVVMPVVEGSGMALSGSFTRISNATPREDLEIDELMQQAVSNLSLHTNDHQLSAQQGSSGQPQSLTVKGSPMQVAHSSTSPYRPPTSTSTTLLNDMIGPHGSGGRSPAYTPEGMHLGPAGKAGGGTVIDTSTSPIPLGPKQGMPARSPILKPSSGELQKNSSSGGGGMKKKPTPAPRGTGTSGQSSSEKRSSGSVSDGDDETSPEADNIEGGKRSRNTPTNSNESWAVFDQPEPPLPPHSSKRQELRHESRHESARRGDKNGPDSPCSSDPKDEWTKAADLREYGRRWPSKGGHTSSSSRDVSPWDEEGPDFRKRHLHGSQSSQPPLPPSHHHQQQHHHHHHATSGERYHHPRMPPRRINSNDEDYEDELMKEQQRGMRRRGMKGGVGSRSRDNFDDEHWYHDHHHATTWSSPTEDDESRAHAGSRSFDRNAYERSTYGPPYEKREPKSLPPYDRRDYKSYDGGKRKYYREREQSRGRSSYDYDPYTGGDGGYGGGGGGSGRGRVDYDDTYGCRGDAREAREYFYDRERKSFDRESNESYDSRERRSGFGSGDLYGSLDSRAEYREQRDRDRDRYLSLDKGRSLRRGMRNAGSARLDQELDQDSEGDLMGGGMMGGRSSTSGVGLRGPDGGVNSLHRSSQNIGRMGGGKHGHGQQQQQQLMDDDVWGVAAKGAGAPWKRPSSATEQDRRYDGVGGGRRSGPSVGGGSSTLIGSDGEKDRRFRKKSRSRTSVGDRKDLELRSSNYATMRYPLRPKEDYFDFDAVEGGGGGGAGHGSGRRNSAGMAALDDDDDDDEEDEEEEEEDGGGRPSGGGSRTAGGSMLMDDPLDDSPAYYGRRQAPPQSSSSSGYYGKSSSLAARHQEQAGGRGNLMNPAEALIAQEAKKMARYEYEEEAQRRMKKSNSRDLYFDGSERGYGGSVTPPKGTTPSSGGSKHHHTTTGGRMEFEFDEFGDSLAPSSGGKFSSGNYDPPGDGFESDFNSPPTMGTATSASTSMVTGGGGQPKSYRFSNDFSIEKDRGGHYGQEHPAGQGHQGNHHRQAPSHHHYKTASAGYGSDSVGAEYSHQTTTISPPPPTSAPSSGSKLRFNENVTVSKFDAEATTMFEDDFTGRSSDVEQDLGGEPQQHQGGWPSSHSTSPGPAAAAQHHHQKQYHQDNIRKSDSINIFAKKVDDPFEDDDFFSSQGAERDPFGGGAGSHDPSGAALDKAQPASAGGAATGTGWDKNFANFDDNI